MKRAINHSNSAAAVGFADEAVGVFLVDVEDDLAVCRVSQSWRNVDSVGFAAVSGGIFYGKLLRTRLEA